jgi:hypothetical protein
MPTRREFIVRSVAGSALAACSLPSRSLFAVGVPEPYDISQVLFDRTSAQGVAFAAEAARRGLATCPVGVDVGGLWMHEIEPRWRQGDGAVVGLTGGVPLFCLGLLAGDYGMRVVYRAEHRAFDIGHVHHRIALPAEFSARWEARLATAGAHWGAAAARLALDCCDAPPTASPLDLLDVPSGGNPTLFSWVIAPVNIDRALLVRRA